nr:thiamine pyrophosphate-dependent enzyme [Bradyrhizobium sp. 164]
MGHCSAVAAGRALTAPARTVLALDGDGSALMHMGVLSTIGYASPNNMIHVVLDNEGYVSTGGQLSTSSSPDAVASACGYRTAALCKWSDHLIAVTQQCFRTSGPLIVCKVNRQHPAASSRHLPIFASSEQDHIPASAPQPPQRASYSMVEGTGDAPKPSSSTLAILRLVYMGNPFESDRLSNNRSEGSARCQCIYSDEVATHSSNVTLTSSLSYRMSDIDQDYHPMLIAGSPSHSDLTILSRGCL